MSDQNVSRRRMLRGLAVGVTATGIGGTASGSDRNVVKGRAIPDDVGSVTVSSSSECSDGVDASNWEDGSGLDGGEHFDRVEVGTADGTAGANAYEDYTCDGLAVVPPGGEFDIEFDWDDAGYDHHYANIWIDWKQTNDWSKAYETKLMADESDDSTSFFGTVQVPEIAADGLTLARLRLSWSDYDGPEWKGTPGEVNDFTISVWASRDCADPTNWPSGTGGSGYEHIDRVDIDSQVEKTSADNAYEDFTCPDKAIFERGDTFDVEMDWSDGELDNHYANLYVDWDQNQDWSTATEYVLLDNVDDDSVTGTTSVTVPNDAAKGPTLARARLSWGGFDEPDADDLGEVNDFTIYVE